MKKFEVTLTAPSFIGEAQTWNSFELEIKNTIEDVQSSTICVQPPLYAKPFQYIEVEIDQLKAGESETIQLVYQFSFGGRYVFYFWEKGAQLQTLNKTNFFVKGSGVYSGDTHTHSLYSDGSSTLSENRESMLQKGHSFLYSTDHNTLEHAEEISKFAHKEGANEFLHMAGWEYTTKYGHALAYGATQIYDPTFITDRNSLKQWQTFVDDMKEDSSVFLAHPYEAPKYEFGNDLLMNINHITGIEVWNGLNHHALTYENRLAFERWDALNKKGNHHYIGNAVSDAHTKEKQGNPFIKGYLKKLDQDNVHQLLKSGSFFGSNGPEIQFKIGKASIGETHYIQNDVEIAKVEFSVFDPAGHIENIVLYKGVQDSKFSKKGRNKTIKVMDLFPSGEADKRYYEKVQYLDVQAGEFYRIEVITKFGIVAYDHQKLEQDKGFAYTNPIWINKEKII